MSDDIGTRVRGVAMIFVVALVIGIMVSIVSLAYFAFMQGFPSIGTVDGLDWGALTSLMTLNVTYSMEIFIAGIIIIAMAVTYFAIFRRPRAPQDEDDYQ